jgi:anti-anti-sigma factor
MSNLEVNVARQYFSGMPIAVVSINGVIDSLNRTELEETIEKLLAENVYRFIFDLSGLEAIGSLCLGFLIKIEGQAREKSGRVVVLNPSEELKTAFEMVGLWDYIPVANDIESALKSFLPPRSEGS